MSELASDTTAHFHASFTFLLFDHLSTRKRSPCEDTKCLENAVGLFVIPIVLETKRLQRSYVS